MAAFIAFAIAQITKCFTYYYTENKWDLTRIIGSGGMPSSHTSMVSRSFFIVNIIPEGSSGSYVGPEVHDLLGRHIKLTRMNGEFLCMCLESLHVPGKFTMEAVEFL